MNPMYSFNRILRRSLRIAPAHRLLSLSREHDATRTHQILRWLTQPTGATHDFSEAHRRGDGLQRDVGLGGPRLLLGSIAEKVLRLSRVPVIAVPPSAASSHEEVLADG